MLGKAFVRKWPRQDGGKLTMLVMLTDGLDNLDDETLYAFSITEIDDSVVLQAAGKRQTSEFRGLTADGILSRF